MQSDPSSAATSRGDDRQPLGTTGLSVSRVAMGCWPIAGVTSLDVNERDSAATLQAAVDAGINFFDTAYCYGPAGESECLVGRTLAAHRESLVIATKGGIHYAADGRQAQDARPETLRAECEESLRRLATDRVELYYLHSPDPQVPITESAGAIRKLLDEGKILAAGVSNATLEQIQAFHAVCPVTAVQLPYNMLQRDIEQATLPWCRRQGVSLTVYWPLMKGLLAGRLSDARPLAADDPRREYPMYQGEEWRRNQQFVAALGEVAQRRAVTVAQLVVNWTMHRPGITAALCGAKRAWQIEETAAAMGWRLSPDEDQRIERAIAQRGTAVAKRVFR
jgi:aryl-alcohol dehydrogenase-like predicted oxidoreductase